MTSQTPSDRGFDPTDPIAEAWANQGEPDGASFLPMDSGAVADAVADAHAKDRRRLLWLNAREVIPSIFVAGVFASAVPDSARPPATLAAAALVLAVGCFLAISSVRHHRADLRWGTAVRDQLARRLAQTNHRATLYRTVGWWYFLPFIVAIVLFQVGTGEELWVFPEDLIFVGVAGPVIAVLYWVNRRIGRTYSAEARRIESLLAEFDQTI